MRSALSKVPRLTLFHNFFFFNFLTCHHHHMLSRPPCFPTILLWSGLPHLYRCRLKKKFSRERFWELNGGIIVPCSPASFLRITEVKSFSSPLMSRRDHRGWSRGHCEAVSFMSLAGWVGVCVCEMLREAGAAACGTLNASAPGDAELNAWCRAAAASPW